MNGRSLQINQLPPSSKSSCLVSKGNLIALFNQNFHNSFDRTCKNDYLNKTSNKNPLLRR